MQYLKVDPFGKNIALSQRIKDMKANRLAATKDFR